MGCALNQEGPMCGDLAYLLNENAVTRFVRMAAFFFGPCSVWGSEAVG